MSGTPRVVVVGARRVRTGTGPFLALQAAQAGAEICAVIGTNMQTGQEACDWLLERGVETRPFVDWEEMIIETAPDALILASPTGTHLPWLRAAVNSGVHVLCEKPLIAEARADAAAMVCSPEEDAESTHKLAQAFASSGLLLRENCQWPFTLEAFRQLHPDKDLSSVQWFRMLMSPSGKEIHRWLELLSHPISLLQEVAPGPVTLLDPHYHDDRELRFTWCTANRELECLIEIVPDAIYPRPAEFSMDKCLMRREIEEGSYRFFFSSEAEKIEAADPMPRSVESFIKELSVAMESGSAPIDESLVRRQKLLAELLNARP